jgi:hypothetical protein
LSSFCKCSIFFAMFNWHIPGGIQHWSKMYRNKAPLFQSLPTLDWGEQIIVITGGLHLIVTILIHVIQYNYRIIWCRWTSCEYTCC